MYMYLLGEDRKMCWVLLGKPEGKKPLGTPRRRWEDWIRIGLKEIGCENAEGIQLPQYRGRGWVLVST
jgi:hypothetical protein